MIKKIANKLPPIWLLLFIIGLLFGRLSHAATCITSDPTSALWPRATCTLHFRSNATAALSTVPQPFDSGALRVGAGGCYEIMFVGGSGEGYYWAPYDPTNGSHVFYSNIYNRYGRGVSQFYYHSRDDASYPITYWQVVHPDTPLVFNSIEHIDTWYCDNYLSKLEAEYWAKLGNNVTCGDNNCEASKGETWQSCLSDCPKPPTPPVSNCDGTCHAADKICENGNVVGGKCPSDCDKPCESEVISNCETCESNLLACKADKDNLQLQFNESQSINTSLTSQRDSLQTILNKLNSKVTPTLPADIASILHNVCSNWVGTGRSRVGQCNKMKAVVCQLVKCPSGT